MTDIPLPPDLAELLTITRTLNGLIEPLQMILALERAPGIGQRLDAFMSELTAIREGIERAADSMAQSVSRQQEEWERQEATSQAIRAMQRDIVTLKTWFSAPPPEAGQS